MTPIFFQGHREKNENPRNLTSCQENISFFENSVKNVDSDFFFQGHGDFFFLFNDWVFDLHSHTHNEKTLSIGISVTNWYLLTTRAFSDKGYLVTSGHLVTNASLYYNTLSTSVCMYVCMYVSMYVCSLSPPRPLHGFCSYLG